MPSARTAAIALLVVAQVAAAGAVRAEGRVDFLANRLKAPDARVRTQAALALGGTDDDGAVAPLCGALDDDAEVVRGAAAAALGKLKRPASEGCLGARIDLEESGAVKAQLARALAAVKAAAGAAAAPKVNAAAKFYVALAPVANASGRPQADIERIALGAARTKLDELRHYQVAPAKEAPAAAQAVLAKRRLKGYYLSLSVEKFDYAAGNLRVRVKLAVFTYPGRDLRGEIPATLTQTSVRPGDTAAEDTLVEMAASRVVELFAQNFR